MDQTALFTISYGVFILGAENNGAKNACIINTCQQLTAEPGRISVTVLKTNLTHYMIEASNKFSVSVLGRQASLDTIAHFGFRSGRDCNKMDDIPYKLDILGTPVIEKDSIATMSCKVVDKIDLGSHTLFVGEVIEAEKTSSDQPMTYSYYRDLKAGKVVQDKETERTQEEKVQYECSVCHYIYDGDEPFETLPDTYTCPICGKPKSVFFKA